MKITRRQLKRLIKEEMAHNMNVAKPAMKESEAYPTSDAEAYPTSDAEAYPTSDGADTQQLEREAEEQYVAIFEKWDSIISRLNDFMDTQGTVDPEHAPIDIDRMGVYEAAADALNILESWDYDDVHMSKEQLEDQLPGALDGPLANAIAAGAESVGKIFGRR